MQMISSLKRLAEVRAGHPFRGSVPLVEGGNTQVIQMRDVSPDGTVAWASLARTDIPTGKSPDWLRDGDILFVARGARYYAVCLRQVPRGARRWPCRACNTPPPPTRCAGSRIRA